MVDPWLADLIKDAGSVVLGWALGVGTTVLADWRKERRKLDAIKRAISAELREIAQRLLVVVYRAEGRRGGLNRELFEWMLPQIERYAGPNPKDEMLAGVKGLLSRTDAELAQLAARVQATTPPHFWPSEEAPYTSSAVAQAHDFDPDYAVRVLDVLSHVRMFNESRENGLHYSRLTFAPGLTQENHTRATANAEAADEQLVYRSRVIIQKTTALEEKHPSA